MTTLLWKLWLALLWKLRFALLFRRRTGVPWRCAWAYAGANLEMVDGDTTESVEELVQERS